jgi:NTP pyrophosphatase (non-canonical NTP hydrolase)
MNISDAQKEAFEISCSKGWHAPGDTRTLGDWITLIHSELSEAYEEYRNGHPINEVRIVNGKPEGVAVEIADAAIRIFDFCAMYDIDLTEVVRLKMDYNRTRSFRHGGKLA